MRNVRMTSSHHDPYALGDTRVTIIETKDRIPRGSANSKNTSLVRITSCDSPT